LVTGNNLLNSEDSEKPLNVEKSFPQLQSKELAILEVPIHCNPKVDTLTALEWKCTLIFNEESIEWYEHVIKVKQPLPPILPEPELVQTPVTESSPLLNSVTKIQPNQYVPQSTYNFQNPYENVQTSQGYIPPPIQHNWYDNYIELARNK